jgi:hypothetical protein
MALIIAFAVGGAVAVALLFREPPEGQRRA